MSVECEYVYGMTVTGQY